MGRYLVIGGAGRTGRHVMADLTRRGHEAVAASRSPGPGGVVLDLAHVDDAANAWNGWDGIAVSVEPPSDRAGAARLLEHGLGIAAAAAAWRGVRLVLVSQIYITRPEAYPTMAPIIEARARGEQALRASGADYTVARPGWLHDGAADGLRLEQGDTGDGPTSRATVGQAVTECLLTDAATRTTFEVFDDPTRPVDWPVALARLTADPR